VNRAALLQQFSAPARDFGRVLALDVAAGALAIGLGMTGGGFLIAAGFALLSRLIGPTAAAAMFGIGLLGLAAAVLLIRNAQRQRHQRRLRMEKAMQQAARDPLPSLVFDLAFMAGRQIFAKRRT